MSKKNCDIVKDLSLGYIENLLKPNSKIFVEEHLATCKECKKYYDALKSEILEDGQKEKKKDEIEINYFKKVRKHMNILKIILIVILAICVIFVGFVGIKHCIVSNIINKAYEKLEDLENLDNYKITVEGKYIDYTTDIAQYTETTDYYYYKDGKAKYDRENEYFGGDLYREDGSCTNIYVYDSSEHISTFTADHVLQEKGDVAKNAYQDLVDFKDDADRFKTLRKSVRTDIFNGEECYVVRDGNDDLYIELWISKEDYSLKKVIKKEESKYYQEQIYTFEENGTTDEDVDTSVFDTEEYENYSRSTGRY